MAWINPLFLFGLGALAIPVVIHLLRSRKHRTAYLGTLRFLEQALRESRRYRRLRDLLLLLARMAALALLCLLFARPYLGTVDDAAVPGQHETVVLVDASGTMAARTLGVRSLDLALEEVERIRADLPDGAGCVVAAFNHDVAQMPEAPVPGGGTDFAAALQWAEERLSTSTADDRHVVIITDLQGTGLPPTPMESWPLDLPVSLVPIAMPGDWNVGITAARPSSQVVAEDIDLVVTLAAHGDVPDDETVPLRVTFPDGSEAAAEAGLESQTLRIPWTPPGPGLYRATVRIDSGDAYEQDNERPFAFFLHAPIRVVLLDGEPGPTPYLCETYFLETALSISRYDAGTSEFRVERRESLGDLDECDILALCNVGALDHAQRQRIDRAVKKGMGLIHFPGDRSGTHVLADLHTVGVLPASVRPEDDGDIQAVHDWDTSHPALEMFVDPEAGDLSRLMFRQSFTMRPDNDARVLAWFDDGTPAVVAAERGAGRILVVAQPSDREWSAWPKDPIFLPLVRELFRHLHPASARPPVITTRRLAIGDEQRPGIYGDDPVSVVEPCPPRETNVAACEEAVFRDRLGIGEAPVDMVEVEEAAPPPATSARDDEIWPMLILVLVALLMLENVLADKLFGRRRAAAAT